MKLATIQAIDVHAHFGTYCGAPFEIVNQWMSGSAEVVVQRARLAHTRLTMVSPLEAMLPRLGGKPVSANTRAAKVVTETEGLMQWVVVNPTQPKT